MQTRPVACVDPTGRPAGDDGLCEGAPPAAEQRCALAPCDFCADNDCFGNGACVDGACACSPGLNVTAAYCQVGFGARGQDQGLSVRARRLTSLLWNAYKWCPMQYLDPLHVPAHS